MNDPLGLFGEEQNNSDPLGLFEETPKKKAGLMTGIKSSFANVGNMADTALSTLAGGAAAIFGDDKEALRIADEMEQRRLSRNQWANPENEELGIGAKVAGTIATLPMQMVGMGLSPAETTRTALQSGESNAAAIRAGLIDAAGNAAGIAIPGFKQGSLAMRAGSGAAVNAAQEVAAKKAIQMSLETEKGKEAFAPTWEDAAVAAAVGGGLGAVSKGQPKQAKPTTNAAKALADLKARKAVDVEVPKAAPEQLQLFDQFEERSPISPYQTEMAPEMWRTDENGIPIRADLSMELQNLQQPLQRNLFGDELDANFPRDPNKPLDMETGDIEGVERFSEPVNFRNDPENQIPLTEAIDSMEPGARAEALATTQMGRELLADGPMEAARMQAEIAAASGDNFNGFNSKMRKQGGGLLVGNKKVTVEQTPNGFVAKVGDQEVGYLRSNITPEQRAMLGEDASVDMVKVLDDFKGKGVGKALYDAWSKANEGNVIPSGKTSPDAWKQWKRNLPGGVDKFVNQEAQRILGGADPQMVIGNIPDPEVAQRVQARAALLKKQGGGVLVNFGKNKQTTTIEDIEAIQRQIDNVGRRYVDGELTHEQMMDLNRELIYKKQDMERLELRRKENVGAGEVTEIFPGYNIIPVGTTVMAKHGLSFAEPTRGKVVGTKQFRYGEKAYNLPLVDFGDGRPRSILPGDVSEVFGGPKNPFNTKKQSGGVLFDWKKKNEVEQLSKIAGIKDKLAAFVPTEMDAEGTIELAKQGKDVDQNLAQRVVNQFTKGGLYQAEKTGNPIVKFTVDKVLNADRKARADVRDYIHDSLAPAMRKLSTQEMIDVAAVLNQADMDQIPVDSNFLRQYGFSDKQIAFAEAHRNTMDKAFEALNKAREAMGKPPVDKRISYAAMAATGDFRKLVYKMDGDTKEVVGVIGANTRRGLQAIEKKLQGKDYIFGEERYAGGTKKGASDVQAIMDVLEHLSENNPATKDFLDVLSDLKAQDAYNFVNMSKHTKQKKGVFGMEGRKQWESDLQNAKDFMDAQLKYAESALRWGHLSEAATEVKKVLASDVDQPNAKKWAEGYFNNALGLNPSETGRSFEKAMDSFWKETGVGKTIPSNIQQYSRKVVNTLLLGLNPAFLATNVVQPLMAMPAMNAFLKGRGLDENSLITLGYDSMAEGWFTMAKERLGGMSSLEQAAAKYAKDNHVFGTDLVDTSSVSRRNAEYYLDKTGNFLASNVESGTRKMMYYGFVHMLDKNGMGKEFGLAQNLTDIAMNNYSPVERPNIFNVLGPVGDMAANLSSFKHNELSRLALFAREIGKEKSATPLLIQLGTGVAAAGITGAIGFAEADWLYRQITKAMGKPDSLTNVVFKFSESMAGSTKSPYALSHGVFSYLGLDLSKRLGVSDVVPNSVGEALFPGGSKLVDVAGAGLSAMGDPSELNMKRLAREVAPGAITGPMDREWFSKETPQGELALNRRTLEGQVIRTEADKMAKNFGFMGVNESVQKQKLWDLKQQGIGYSELRSAVVKKMAEQMFTKGKFEPALIDNYIKYEGDLKTLETELENKVKKQEMSAVDALKLKAMAAKRIPQLYQGQRVMESFQ